MFVGSILLFLIGVCLGSFVNALVWRVHQQSRPKRAKSKSSQLSNNRNLSIINGRSMCTHCHHELAPLDLIPLVSWLALRGKCRYCKKPISDSPIVELCGGFIFIVSYLSWPHLSDSGQWLLLATWLAASVGLLALAIYDIKWQLLPNRILYPTFFVALAGRVGYLVFYSPNKLSALISLMLSIGVASGIFWIIFMLSDGKWIGYGDVRLGLVTGTLLASPSKALLMIFLSSLIGTLAVMPSLARSKRTASSKIPYGPYLITSTMIVVIYGERLLNWYTKSIGL